MKNILITGASRGIGRAIAVEFGQREGNLFLNSASGGERLENVRDEIVQYRNDTGIEGRVILCPGDVSEPETVGRIFDTIGPGGVDILINNAGISHIGLIQDMTDGEWRRVIDVNLSSVNYCCRAAIPHMLAAGEGRILNISSVWGNIGASCEVAYSAAKGGVNAYTKALAKELAPAGIAVNAIACGCVDTDMNSHFDDNERQALYDEIPAGRWAKPQEVAQLAGALCEQSTYLTGQVITFDGGWT